MFLIFFQASEPNKSKDFGEFSCPSSHGGKGRPGKFLAVTITGKTILICIAWKSKTLKIIDVLIFRFG